VLGREGVERAVGQGQPGRIVPGLVSLLVQGRAGGGEQRGAGRVVPGLLPRQAGHLAAPVPGRAVQRLGHRLPRAPRVGDGPGHELPGELVAPLGQRDGQLP
jgi:hypothetical protein